MDHIKGAHAYLYKHKAKFMWKSILPTLLVINNNYIATFIIFSYSALALAGQLCIYSGKKIIIIIFLMKYTEPYLKTSFHIVFSLGI